MGRGAQKKQTLQSAAIMRKRHWECLLDLVLSYLFYACVASVSVYCKFNL